MSDGRNRIIVVTGATRGIGRALTDQFVKLGHTIIGSGRSQGLIDDLAARYGAPHSFATVDVAKWSEVEVWAANVLSESPPPDLVINNAGVINRTAPLWEV